MSKRPKKMDLNQLAKRIVDEATEEIKTEEEIVANKIGAAGGKKRSDSMTKEQRVDAARLAALARWKKSD